MGTKILSVLAAVSLTAVFGIAAGAEGDNVAKIGEQEYSTLQDAINVATGDTEIDLMSNTAEDVSIPSGKTVTIDLSGYKITNITGHTITNNGTLTINDSSSSHAGTVDNVTHQKAAVYNESGATAMLNAGTYERSLEAGDTNGNNGNSYYTIYNQGNMEISNAVINNKGTYSSCIINGGFEDGAKLTIDGATVTGGINAIKNDEYGSTLTITSGTFTNSALDGAVILNAATANINGGTFNGSGACVINVTQGHPNKESSERKNSTTTITTGTFNATGTNTTLIYAPGNTTMDNKGVSVSGGTFSGTISTNLLDTGNVIVKEENSYVVENDNKSYAARYAGVRYNSINEAINDNRSDTLPQNIYLLRDISENVVIPEGHKIQIDLNSYKITNDDTSIPLCNTITNNGTLTIRDTSAEKNGTIDNVSHQKAAIYNEAGATATLNAGTYTRSKEAGSSPDDNGGNSYYYIVNHGTMTLSNINVISRGSYSSLIENGWYDGTKDHPDDAVATMTIKNGTFSGGINTIKNDDWGILTINGGTFSNVKQYPVYNVNVTTINDGTFDGNGGEGAVYNWAINNTMDKGIVTITGGKFTGGIREVADGWTPVTDVSGGTFDTDVSEYLADGCAISTGTNSYSVLNPDNHTASIDTAGTYKSATNADGYYDQMDIMTTSGLTSGSIRFNVTNNNSTKSTTLDYNTATVEGSQITIGLIITGIPAEQTVSVSIAE